MSNFPLQLPHSALAVSWATIAAKHPENIFEIICFWQTSNQIQKIWSYIVHKEEKTNLGWMFNWLMLQGNWDWTEIEGKSEKGQMRALLRY